MVKHFISYMEEEKKSMEGVLVLPEELMTEVLVRLPAETLLVCKSVSKPWLSLVSNPNFIKSHLHYVINNNNNNPTLLDILDPSAVNSINLIDAESEDMPLFNGEFVAIPDWLHNIEAMLHSYQRKLYVTEAFLHGTEHALSRSPFRVSMPSGFGNCRVVGTSCCDGIICLRDDHRNVVYLWNRAIRRYKEVRVPGLDVSALGRAKIGFGYDSTCSEYKVFMILCDVNLGSVPLKLQVYSVNTDSWREFQGPVWRNKLEEGEFQRNEFTVVNGILYFSNGDEHQVILFDLRKEVFRVVPFPSVVRRWSDVLEFKGSVAMAFESVSGVDLWRLDDDVSGEVSSWKKMFSIEIDPKLDMWLSCYLGAGLWLSCYLGAGQFYGKMLMKGNVFVYNVLYDWEKKETKHYGLGEDNVLATLKYAETLVSLDGFRQVEDSAN